MAHRRSGTERIIAELPTVCWRFRFSISRRGFIFPGAFLFLAVAPPAQRFSFPPSRRDHRPALLSDHFRDATKMISAASVSRRKGGFFFTQNRSIFVSVAFLTPPTFPALAPRKRFFDPLPKKILGFRTRKGRLPRRQYLARARLEFLAGLRVVVSSRARAFGISCGLLAGGAGGGLAALAVDGWRCACAPARHGISARACAFGISCACAVGGAGGWLAVPLTAGAGRRPADRLPPRRHSDRRPHRSGPPRPPAAGGGSAAVTVCRAGLSICRRAGRSRRRGYLPRPVSSPDKLS